MKHADHVSLLRDGIPGPGGKWADFGSGTGAFTLALVDLIGPQGEVYSIDKNGRALREQQQTMQDWFPEQQLSNVHYLQADFTRPLDLPPLDGIIMANALHFLRQKEPLVRMLINYLRPGGRFILVEYNVDAGNVWVPYPLSYATWEALAWRCGFTYTRLLARAPSHFLKEFYSAASW